MLSPPSAPGISIFENPCNVVVEGACERISYIYGGVKFDACVLGMMGSGLAGATKEDPVALLQWGPAYVLFVAFMAADLPLSFAADTLLLPIMIPRQSKLGDHCPVNWTPTPWPSAGDLAESRQTVIQPLTGILPSGTAVIELSDGGLATPAEVNALESEILRLLHARGRDALPADAQSGTKITSGVVVRCSVTEIRRVTRMERNWSGAGAGSARVAIRVTLVDPGSDAVLAEADVIGISSGASISSGTAEEAIAKAAEAVVNFAVPES